jgi:hypothetical protein
MGLGWEELRDRFQLSGERERERERKRLSDDLERLRRRDRELELERVRWEPWVTARSREGDPLMPEKEMNTLEAAARYVESTGSSLPSWARPRDEERVDIDRPAGWRRRYS